MEKKTALSVRVERPCAAFEKAPGHSGIGKDAHAVETGNLFTANILCRIGFPRPLIEDSYLNIAAPEGT